MKIKSFIAALLISTTVLADGYIPVPGFGGVTANSCPLNQFANAIDASGILTCGPVSSSGITSINSDTTAAQLIVTASTGTDFTIATSSGTTTVAIPSASATARGLITTGTQTIAGAKTFSGAISASNLSGTNTGDQTITLTGDVTGSGTGSFATTLATVNSNVGSFGSSTSIPSFTVNGKGLITAASGNVVIAPAGTLTGTTLASNVVSSSLTSVGTITSGTWNGTTIAVANGGTGATTETAHGVLLGQGTSAVTATSVGATNTVLHGNTGADPTYSDIVNADIDAAAAISFSKLASLTNTHFLVGNASNVATDVAMSGDATLANTGAVTLASVASAGTTGSSTSIPAITINVKGLVTSVTGNAVIAPAGTLTGTTLASNVVSSSLTSVGTITSGTWNGTTIAVANGGTNSTTSLNNNRFIISSGGKIVEQSALTGNRAVVTDSNGLPVASATTDTEISYVSGVTSSIQTQLNAITNGLVFKAASDLATAAALPANVYNNGSSGVGATLTGVGFGALVVDGTTVTTGQRILVKNEATTSRNGIYTVTTVGAVATLYVLTRATDFNQTSNMDTGSTTFILNGSTNVDTQWTLSDTGAITPGTTAITFVQTAGAGTILAGTGITVTGNTVALTTPVIVGNGGIGASTETAHGVLLGQGTSAVTATSVGATNTVLHGNTGADPTYSDIVNADVDSAAAIAFSKLAALTNTHILVGNGSNVATDVALSGDATLANTGAITLASVASAGTTGSSTSIPAVTINAKGLVTSITGNAVIAPAGTLTGATLAAGVTASSLTSVGTITSGTWNGTTIAIANGGTGQTTANAGFNALSPMTTLGDITYEDATPKAVRLAGNTTSTNKFLTQTGNGTISAVPAWNAIVNGDVPTTLTGKTLSGNTATNLVNGSGTFNFNSSGTITAPNATDTLVGKATTDTLTNKTLTSPVIATIVNTGTLTLPTSTDTLVGRATTDTLTNKTLTAPVIATIVNTGTLTLPTSTDTLVGRATTDTLTNKRITKRVVSMSDATSFTPTGDTADENTQANTQSTGTLTANAPSGTPTDGQLITIRIKSTNVQTFSWNAIYRGSTDTALPTVSSGSSKTDYFGFMYNAADSKWDLLAVNQGH